MKNRIFFLLLFTSLLFSQNEYDFKQFVNEGVDYYSAPFHWDSKDFLFLGLAAASTYAAMQFDKDVKQFTQLNRDGNSSIPILVGRYYGEPILPVLLSSYFIINGNSTGNRFQKKLGFEIAQATFYASATTQIIKMIFGRERPDLTDDNTNFTGPTLFDNDFWSLPSGHTTVAFALSTVLSNNTESDLLKVVSFLPAILTAYARVYENRHWLSDVVLGGIIGYTTAKFFVRTHENKNSFASPEPTELISITIPIN